MGKEIQKTLPSIFIVNVEEGLKLIYIFCFHFLKEASDEKYSEKKKEEKKNTTDLSERYIDLKRKSASIPFPHTI